MICDKFDLVAQSNSKPPNDIQMIITILFIGYLVT